MQANMLRFSTNLCFELATNSGESIGALAVLVVTASPRAMPKSTGSLILAQQATLFTFFAKLTMWTLETFSALTSTALETLSMIEAVVITITCVALSDEYLTKFASESMAFRHRMLAVAVELLISFEIVNRRKAFSTVEASDVFRSAIVSLEDAFFNWYSARKATPTLETLAVVAVLNGLKPTFLYVALVLDTGATILAWKATVRN